MSILRKGTYAGYKGKEYRFIEGENNTIKLISNDINDSKFGFTPSNKNNDVYTKVVDIEETEYLVYITPFATYKGYEFPASKSSEGKILLDTNNIEIAKKLGFEQTDKYLYSKIVTKSEVEIIENKKQYSL